MSPEERKQFNEMKERLENMENQINSSIIENQKSTFDGYKGDDDDAVERIVSVGESSADVLDYPDDFILVRLDGKVGRLPWYSETRF